MMKVNRLCKIYGKNQVLIDINTDFERSSIYGIVGYNGAGKTTFFNCLADIVPYKGEVVYERNLDIGYLPTEIFMYPKITGKEYVEFCLSARKRKLDPQQLHEWNSIMKLPLNKYAKEYSTGMLKKLALLGLILQRNQILILDEPFNGLDLSTNIILSKVLTYMKEAGKLIMISSHVLEPLKCICDSIDILENGNLKRYTKENFGEIDKYFESKVNKLLNREKLLV